MQVFYLLDTLMQSGIKCNLLCCVVLFCFVFFLKGSQILFSVFFPHTPHTHCTNSSVYRSLRRVLGFCFLPHHLEEMFTGGAVTLEAYCPLSGEQVDASLPLRNAPCRTSPLHPHPRPLPRVPSALDVLGKTAPHPPPLPSYNAFSALA